MTGHRRWPQVLAVVTAAMLTAMPAAQERPVPEVTVVANADGVRPAGAIRLAVRVSLPEGIHVQSNRPRDPLLIPTVVTPTLSAGVSLVETVYPPATDFVQAGLAEPLSVFEHRFAIGLELAFAPGVPPGDVTVPVRLRYQACNDRTCFPPSRRDLAATVRVVAPGTRPVPQFADLFQTLRFTR
jgi:thiol:disulfide interchange protein DsbD